ncbi:MAG TPA: hypothetical protein VM599_03290 [Thermoanaerobaculia bacterium]|nr:hypothetical protein [Thermoanaerobaculia bacterium]
MRNFAKPFLLTSLILAAWCGAAPLAAVAPFPLPASTAVELGDFGLGDMRLAGHPDEGWLLVGTDFEAIGRIKAVRIAPDGTLGKAAITEELDPIDVLVLALAVTSSGRWVAVWTGEDWEFSSPQAALFEPDGTLVREIELSAPDEVRPASLRRAVVAAVPDGGFVIAWGARTAQTQPADDIFFSADLFAARFSASGELLAGPELVNELRIGFQAPTGIAVGPTAVVVTWDSWCCESEPSWNLRARALALDLSPLSGVVEVNEGRYQTFGEPGKVLAVDSSGRFVVAWAERLSPAEGDPLSQIVLFRRFEATGEPAEPATPVAMDWTGLRRLASAATPSGAVWMTWADGTPGEVWARPFSFSGAPLGPAVPTGFSWDRDSRGIFLAADPASRVLIVTDEWPDPALGLRLEGRAPPPENALTSPELPGYRVWVLITGRPGDSRWGAEVPACLAETICASGAVPGRVEVMVRVVGPKPNGFLWPLLVKLTTSRVEVWIEQEATGELRYYLLPGASPGDDTLPGLFDRRGFSPE